MKVSVTLDDEDWKCIYKHLNESRIGKQVKSQIAHGQWAEEHREERDRLRRICSEIREARRVHRKVKKMFGSPDKVAAFNAYNPRATQ